MAITDWPIAERPREKLLNRGPQTLSDAELLAIFLRTGVSGKTAVDLARDLLNEYGGLRALLQADRQTFCQGHGLGSAKYALLQAILEMGRRHLYETMQRGDALGNPTDTRRYLLARLRDYPHEVFTCLFLDNRHRVIEFTEMFRGTIDGTSVHPREVVKQALALNAAAVILAHNHPLGVAETQPGRLSPYPTPPRRLGLGGYPGIGPYRHWRRLYCLPGRTREAVSWRLPTHRLANQGHRWYKVQLFGCHALAAVVFLGDRISWPECAR